MGDVKAEAIEKLQRALDANTVPVSVLEAGFPEFSVDIKNELVARLAGTFGPSPSGRLLARLLFILTEENKGDMASTFVANLRSTDPNARKASLYGLEKLNHPGVADFALAALRDDDDEVLTAATSILLPLTKDNPRLAQVIESLHETNKDDPSFYLSMNLIKSHLEKDKGTKE